MNHVILSIKVVSLNAQSTEIVQRLETFVPKTVAKETSVFLDQSQPLHQAVLQIVLMMETAHQPEMSVPKTNVKTVFVWNDRCQTLRQSVPLNVLLTETVTTTMPVLLTVV